MNFTQYRSWAAGLVLVTLVTSGCSLKLNQNQFESQSPSSTETVTAHTPEWAFTHRLSRFSHGTVTVVRKDAEVAMNASGQAIMAWIQEAPGLGYRQIFKAERNAAGQWTRPESVRDYVSSNPWNSDELKVAINGSGQAIIAWTQEDTTRDDQMYVAERDAQGRWHFPTHESDCLTPPGSYAFYPRVSLNAAGQVLLVWLANGPSFSTAVYKATRDQNGVWTKPFDLNDRIIVAPGSGSINGAASVALNDLGEGLITWEQGAPYSAQRAIDGQWTFPADASDSLSPIGMTSTANVRSALTNQGVAMVLWNSGNGASLKTYYAERAASGTWTLPVDANDALSVPNEQASITNFAANLSGQAVLITQRGSYFFKHEREANGVWTHPVDSNDVMVDGYAYSIQSLSVDPQGRSLFVWGRGSAAYKAERSTNGSWTYPIDNSDSIVSNHNYELPSALGSDGLALIAWFDPQSHLFVASHDTSGTWQYPASSNDSFEPDQMETREPAVATSPSGKAIAAWVQKNLSGRWVLLKSERGTNGLWDKPDELTVPLSIAGFDATAPQVAVNDSGEALVVWQQASKIFMAERNASGAWTTPADASAAISTSAFGVSSPLVSLQANGAAAITWVQGDGSVVNQVYAALRAPNGAWTFPSSPTDSVTFSPHGVGKHSLKMDSDGNSVLAWDQVDADGVSRIYRSEKEGSNSWNAPVGVSDPALLSTTNAYLNDLALNNRGQAIVTWQAQALSGYTQIYRSERESNRTWSNPPAPVEHLSLDGVYASNSHVAINSKGEVRVIWEQTIGGQQHLFEAQRTEGGQWVIPLTATESVNPQSSPVLAGASRVALTDQGHEVIAWSHFKSTRGAWEVAIAERTGASSLSLRPETPETLYYGDADLRLATAPSAEEILLLSSINQEDIYLSQFR